MWERLNQFHLLKSKAILFLLNLLTLSHLQTTFENIVAKGEIAHDMQFFLWPQCFQLYLTIKLSFMEIFQVFASMC